MSIACTIDTTGIHAPAFEDVLSYLKDQYKLIYGQDVYFENDSQDGQWLSIIAASIHDVNSMAVSVYNSFAPSTAQGIGLDRVVKVNGISRTIPTNSTVDLLIGGTAGTVITDGIAADDAGNRWFLPASVTIPPAGQVTVSATAEAAGSVSAPAGAISVIYTPTRGWQTVTNPLAASLGDPIETDRSLRTRQAISTEIPSSTLSRGIAGAIASLSGVTSVSIFENDTNATDDNGIPGHSICCVIEGGVVSDIVNIISLKKTPGTGTYGSTTEVVISEEGVPSTISFQRKQPVPISVIVNVQALDGYTTIIEDHMKEAIVEYLSGLPTGETIYCRRIYVPAQLSNSDGAGTYDLLSVLIGRDPDTPTAENIDLAFYEHAEVTIDDIYVVVS